MAPLEVYVQMLPDALIKEAITAGPLWRVFGERIRTRSAALAPVSKSQELGDDDYGKPGGGDHLKDSLQVRFVTGVDPRIEIFSTQTVGGGLSKLALVLLGTEAHPIDPVEAKALVFTVGGQVVFAGHVDHPGTSPNNFVLEAVKQICREVGGAVV